MFGLLFYSPDNSYGHVGTVRKNRIFCVVNRYFEEKRKHSSPDMVLFIDLFIHTIF